MRRRRGQFSLGGLCGCCGPVTTTICVTACSGIPVYGVTIQLLTGSTVIASCTTPSSGCCAFTQTGSYTVKVILNGNTCSSTTQTLSGTTINIDISSCSAALVCCGGYFIPKTLTLTDAAGSLSSLYCSALSGTNPCWTTARSVTKISSVPSFIGSPPICVPGGTSSGPVMVCYTMFCMSGSSPVFSLARRWGYVMDNSSVNVYYQNAATPSPGQDCTSAGPPISCSGGVDFSSGSANPSSSSPFAISFTLTPGVGNQTSDPVGGSVSVSQ